MMANEPAYICPICQSFLHCHNKTLTCENHHCFDIAKEGYVNLLPVQKKNSINPGDNKIMIQSRKQFLNKRYYDFLIAPCAEMIDTLIAERFDDCCLLDIGCGDGFFTHRIYSQLKQTAFCYGMDISKEAVKASAKTDPSIAWFVASSNDIPLKDHSIDVMLKINAPLNYQKNILKLSANGIVISITPGESHLNGLKSIIYEHPKKHNKEACPRDFALLASEQITKKMQLNNETDIKNLFMMTPFYWNASQENKDSVSGLQELRSDIAFDINVWGKQ